ncbi:DUF881 domain-containing protein [Nocardioides sp. ChNu-153]|uniref:DUF881 domain-containing protein n=1 Tax=unclassified Nocardioides TaxID=2615069 RepID=UPI002404CF53|nr:MULTISPECIES: DUF881 domain-containing protein [unclassified Nocardioides]MDF9717083.1 DUF881 domain-containing protein [Nocardioides sp. ChNu-99]MDN7121512.1 DUF881 domain-containing protein [Nocardioides sp. ChNu-153]
MSSSPDPSPDAPASPRAGGRGAWRWGTPVVLLLSGGLFVASALSSDGTDLRPGRYRDLSSVVQAEGAQAEALTARVNELNEEIARLSEGLGDGDVDDRAAEAERLRGPAGLTATSGEGLTVTLSDSPESVREAAAGVDANLFVVHQQDIQSVVNALWAGGAEAITIQGQRIISTTGIKCEGNAILLQGIPYPQPYEISAIGDVDDLRLALDDDPQVEDYREYAANPAVALGWDLEEESSLEAPEYQGLLDLDHAQPLT